MRAVWDYFRRIRPTGGLFWRNRPGAGRLDIRPVADRKGGAHGQTNAFVRIDRIDRQRARLRELCGGNQSRDIISPKYDYQETRTAH